MKLSVNTQCSGACDYCIWNRPHPGEQSIEPVDGMAASRGIMAGLLITFCVFPLAWALFSVVSSFTRSLIGWWVS